MKTEITQTEVTLLDYAAVAADGARDALTALEQQIITLFGIESWDHEQLARVHNYVWLGPGLNGSIEFFLETMGVKQVKPVQLGICLEKAQ